MMQEPARPIDLPLGPAPVRLAAVDAARGAALAAMALYHLVWDLSFLGFIPGWVAVSGPWVLFARLIAGSFLALVGVSLVLASRNGFNWRGYLRRLAVIVAAAAAITLATRLAFPGAYIRFGILHAIALFSVLALPFLRAPVILTLVVALFVLAAPRLIGPVVDESWLLWLGLARRIPAMNDYVPVVPWFGVTLCGVAAARVWLRRPRSAGLACWRARAPASRLAVWAGRRSLILYLLHQPVLLAVLYPLAPMMP